jgi:hypothetical protein
VTCAVRVDQHKLLCQSVEIRQDNYKDQFGFGFPQQCSLELRSLVGPQAVLEPLIKQWGNVLNAKSSKLVIEVRTLTEGFDLELKNMILTALSTSMSADGMVVYESLSFVGTSCESTLVDPNAPRMLSPAEMRDFLPKLEAWFKCAS